MTDRTASAAIVRASQLNAAAEVAKAQILADGDEWRLAAATYEDIGEDGGQPIPLMTQLPKKRPSKT